MMLKVCTVVLSGLILQCYAATQIERTLVGQIDKIYKSHLLTGVQELLKQNTSCLNQNSTLIVQQLEQSSNITNMTGEITGVIKQDLVELAKKNMTEFVITISGMLGTKPEDLANKTFSYITGALTGRTNGTGAGGGNTPLSQVQKTVATLLSGTTIGRTLLGNSSIVAKVQAVLGFVLELIGVSKPQGVNVNPTCYDDIIGIVKALNKDPMANVWALQSKNYDL